MKKKYPNLMMQSASSYDTSQVKKDVEQQVKEEQAMESIPTNSNESDVQSSNSAAAQAMINAPTIDPISVTVAPTVNTKPAKPRLRQQAYYLTEIEIKTIKRLSYELDIPKSDLVRKFIDEGIAQIEKEQHIN